MTEESVSFKVKRNYVHITEDALKIWNDPSLASFSESDGMARLYLSIFGRLLIIAYFSYKYLIQDSGIIEARPFSLVFIGILVVVYVAQTVYNLQFSYTNNIPRESIHSITYKKGITLFVASHLIVYFEQNGKQRRRFIPFSGLFGDPNDKKDGLQKLKEAGLYKPGAEDENLLDSI